MGGHSRLLDQLAERAYAHMIRRYARRCQSKGRGRREGAPSLLELPAVDHPALVGSDPDRALALLDLDGEAQLPILDHFVQPGVHAAARALGGRAYVLDADLEADRGLAVREVLE